MPLLALLPQELRRKPTSDYMRLFLHNTHLRNFEQCTRIFLGDKEQCSGRTGRCTPTLFPLV